MLRPSSNRRARPEAFFRPRSVLLVGVGTAVSRAIAANLAGFPGQVRTADPDGIGAYPAADLAILACEPGQVAAALLALAEAGIFAVVCATPAPDLAERARAAGVQVLGPASFGLMVPALGLNASTSHLPPRAGKVALVSQSAALCRAVLDWAEPNGVGFSYVIGTGGNAQTGFSLSLDWLSRDAGTGAILLDIRSLRDRGSFLAAARAAARLRPVVAIRAGGRLHDPSGRADAVFGAALRRAGVLRVAGYADLLVAAEVLTHARPPRTEQLAIVTNAIGPAHMGADAAVGLGLPLLELDTVAQTVLRLRLPGGPSNPGIIWTGADQPTRLAEAAAMLSGVAATGGVVVILAPTGAADAAAVEALIACRPTLKVPLLACVLGETTGAAHRRALAEAGLPVFATPEAAVWAFGHLVQQKRVRAAAAELPPRRVLCLAPDKETVSHILDRARAAGRGLTQDEALAVLSAYGMAVVPGRVARGSDAAADAAARLGFPVVVKRRRVTRPPAARTGNLVLDLVNREAVRLAARRLDPAPDGLLVQRQAGRAREVRITVADDPLFGPAVGFGLGGSAAALLGDVAYDLPPLNLVLARALIARIRAGGLLGAQNDQPAADLDAVADALVRISQLVIDHPEIAEIDVNPLFADAAGVSAADAWIGLRPAGERADFAIAAYPADLAGTFDARGETLLIRPIRPEDAEAHVALFGRLTPEDIRYRFFNMLRELPREQIARMTQVDYDREMAFVAVREATGETVGVCRLVREPGSDRGEFAIVVEPSMKGRGLARRLMQRVMEWGRRQGMQVVVGQVLAENAPMLAFMRRMGAVIRRMPEEPQVVEAVIELA